MMNMRAILFLIMQIWAAAAEFCSPELRMKIGGHFSVQGKNIKHNGVIYPEGAHWSKGGEIFGCPCQLKDRPCIPLCSKVPDGKFELEVWDGVNNKSVKLSEHFIPIENLSCHHDDALLDGIKYQILINGSLRLLWEDENENDLFLGPDEYCIMNKQSEVSVYFCENKGTERMHPDGNFLIAYLYTTLMLVSVVFLLLTLVAFFFAPEMQNLHGKSIACQSSNLMVAFIALSIAMQTHIVEINAATCKIIAYISHFFFLNSFFWLNTMCFDIYSSFSDHRKISGAPPAKKFLFYAIYSTTSSLALFVIMATMDNILDDSFLLWPGIGEGRCWFKNYWAEFAFYHGPILLIVIANAIFSILTFVKIGKAKNETAVLDRGDSKTLNSTKENKQRPALYIKLSLLMNGTWFLETISWIAGEPTEIWIVTDCINCLRGVMIFYLCVWSNKKVRRSLLSRISNKCASSSQTEQSVRFEATAALSDVPQHDASTFPADDNTVM